MSSLPNFLEPEAPHGRVHLGDLLRNSSPSPLSVISDASRNEDNTFRTSTTYRVQDIPAAIPADDVANMLSRALRIEKQVQGLRICSLARDSRGAGQVATVMFDAIPEALSGIAGRSEWTFTADFGENKYLLMFDTSFVGFTALYSPPEECRTSVDCIAISGIGSNAFGSFKQRGGTYMWLRDSLPIDLPNARILIYGYKSHLDRSQSSKGIKEFGADFRAELRMIQNRMKNAPLIFIAHSFGGIVVKQALVEMYYSPIDDLDYEIVRRTRGALFFGVPNNGLAIDSLLPIVEGQRNKPFIQSLKPDSQDLKALDEKWSYIKKNIKKNIKLYSFYETRMSPTAIKVNDRWRMAGPPAMLVEIPSATLGTQNEHVEPIDRTHSELVKFSEHDTIYLRVVQYLKDLAGALK